MRFIAGAATDTGLVRRGNEDSYFVGPGIVAVADGMGGHLGGGTASALAVEACAEVAASGRLEPADVVAMVERANDEVVRRADQDPSLHGMGTTLTGAAVVDVAGVPHLAVFNVGDSRVYRYDRDAVTRLTVDHSQVEQLVAAGTLTADEARVHPGRHVITRSIGTVPGPVVDVVLVSAGGAGRLLVCSDGLTGELADDRIAALLATADPQAAAEALVAAAVAAGGRDNVTAVVADVESDTVVDAVVDDPTAPRPPIPAPPS